MAEAASDLRIYLDTNFFIRAVEGATEVSDPARGLLQVLRKHAGSAVTSEITFAEVLAPTTRPDSLPPAIKRRAYLDLLLWGGFIQLVPVSRGVLIETADLRVVSRLKLPDAIHLVSAIQSGCKFFVSADRGFEKLPMGMELVSPDNSADLIQRFS